MKYLFVLIFFIFNFKALHPQVSSIDQYCDSIDVKVSGEYSYGIFYRQSINMERNVRAIGLQKTIITIYYGQPEDSVYDDGKKSGIHSVLYTAV